MRSLISAVLIATLISPVGMIQEAAASQKRAVRAGAVKPIVVRRVVQKRPPNTYDSCAECWKALREGRAFYQPTYFGDAKKLAKRPVAYIRGLEADWCVRLKVAGGRQLYVPQRAGTPYDFDADNRMIRRHDCGNEAEACEPKARPEAPPSRPAPVARPTVPPPVSPPVQQSPKARQDGEVNVNVQVQGDKNEVKIDFRKAIKEAPGNVERVHKDDGWSTGVKVTAGTLATAGVVTLVYFLTKKNNRPELVKFGGVGPRP